MKFKSRKVMITYLRNHLQNLPDLGSDHAAVALSIMKHYHDDPDKAVELLNKLYLPVTDKTALDTLKTTIDHMVEGDMKRKVNEWFGTQLGKRELNDKEFDKLYGEMIDVIYFNRSDADSFYFKKEESDNHSAKSPRRRSSRGGRRSRRRIR
jgi:hypothetical protein